MSQRNRQIFTEIMPIARGHQNWSISLRSIPTFKPTGICYKKLKYEKRIFPNICRSIHSIKLLWGLINALKRLKYSIWQLKYYSYCFLGGFCNDKYPWWWNGMFFPVILIFAWSDVMKFSMLKWKTLKAPGCCTSTCREIFIVSFSSQTEEITVKRTQG